MICACIIPVFYPKKSYSQIVKLNKLTGYKPGTMKYDNTTFTFDASI
jgi:hypothetical protein